MEDMEKIDDWDLSYKTNVNAKMSPWDTKTTNVNIVIKWVRDILYAPDTLNEIDSWATARSKINSCRCL